MTDSASPAFLPVDPVSAATDPSDVNDPAATSASSDPAVPQKSPLDILEEILGETAAAGGAGAPGPGAEAVPLPTAVIDPEPTLSPEEYAALMEAQKAEDHAALQAQIAELSAIKETPAYHARVQQDAASEAQADKAEAAGEGYEIVQLGHTKIAEEIPPAPEASAAPPEV